MSCGCGGGGRGEAPAYHPSDSYHWNASGTGAGAGAEPELPRGAEVLDTRRESPGPEQADRASSASGPAAAAPDFPWGLALVVGVIVFLVRRGGA